MFISLRVSTVRIIKTLRIRFCNIYTEGSKYRQKPKINKKRRLSNRSLCHFLNKLYVEIITTYIGWWAENTAVGIRHADHVVTSLRKS
jgi:hypothetical protein